MVSDELYSVEQVAERLGLHVRTIRSYIRDGRLKAIRIGKQYRISRADLEELTGRETAASPRESVERHRHVEVSSIVHVAALSAHDASRLATLLTAAASGRGPREQRLTVRTIYDEERASMKVIIIGGLADCAEVLRLVGVVVEDES